MYYGEIKDCDIADGPGVRVSLFVSGCTNHCEGCFQPQTWNFEYGTPYTVAAEEKIMNLLDRPYIAGLTILGGEPFEPSNQEALLPLIRRVKAKFPEKTIWMYSGFTLDEMKTEGAHPRCEVTDEILSLIDVLVDGRFVLALRNLALHFRGSENQRLVDMVKTREQGEVVLWKA